MAHSPDYSDGYTDGFCGRAMAKTTLDYNQGYRDGRAAKRRQEQAVIANQVNSKS